MRKKSSNVESYIRSMDDLAVMTDEELNGWETELRTSLERTTKRGWDATGIEVELAYVQREWQIRDQRAAYHARWVDQLKRDLFEEERNLPVFVHSEPHHHQRGWN